MRRSLIPALLACILLFAACGGDDEPSAPAPAGGGGGGETINVTATEGGEEPYGFDPKELSAQAGKVTLDLALPGDLKAPHAIAVEGNGVEASGETVQPGSSSKLTEDLKAGTYTFYCPVGDHRAEGMEGKLTVE